MCSLCVLYMLFLPIWVEARRCFLEHAVWANVSRAFSSYWEEMAHRMSKVNMAENLQNCTGTENGIMRSMHYGEAIWGYHAQVPWMHRYHGWVKSRWIRGCVGWQASSRVVPFFSRPSGLFCLWFDDLFDRSLVRKGRVMMGPWVLRSSAFWGCSVALGNSKTAHGSTGFCRPQSTMFVSMFQHVVVVITLRKID